MTEPAFLIDSNIAIYILKDAQSPSALKVQSMYPGEVVTSVISYAEVMRGIPGEAANRDRARALFAIVPPLPFDMNAAEAYARVPFRRHRLDRLIAAHAMALGVTLVTNNETDFADIPGLNIENWT